MISRIIYLTIKKYDLILKNNMKIIEEKPPNGNNKYNEFFQTLHNTGIPLLHFIPKTKSNHFFYKNGLSEIIPRLKVKVHTDIEECYDLWNRFSPKKSLFDLWEIRYAMQKAYKYNMYFYTLYEGTSPIACLPLWFDSEYKEYRFWGGWWMEDNTFFVKEEKVIDLLGKIIPSGSILDGIIASDSLKNLNIQSFLQIDDAKNLQEISQYPTMTDYLMDLKKKSRYNLKSDYKKIADLSPEIIHNSNAPFSQFEDLVNMNKERFTHHSYFNNKNTIEAFRNIFASAGEYTYKTIEVYIQNELAASDLIIGYKDVYYMIIGANDVKKYNGIGYFMLYSEIEDAIQGDYSLIDCLAVDYGWKHRYFDQYDRYKIEKK